MGPAVLLLTLDSGVRRAVPLLCQSDMPGNASYPASGDVTTGSGGMVLVSPGFCQLADGPMWTEWQVGAPEHTDYLSPATSSP